MLPTSLLPVPLPVVIYLPAVALSRFSWCSLKAFPEKWLHKLVTVLQSQTREAKLDELQRYFQLRERHNRFLDGIQSSLVGSLAEVRVDEEDSQGELENITLALEKLRPNVEEFIESELSLLLREQDLVMEYAGIKVQFPPADIRFARQPYLMIKRESFGKQILIISLVLLFLN